MARADTAERAETPIFAEPIIYPLETGDHLTRGEFERRFDAMPEIKKAELIEGIVYMSSPVRLRHHGSPHAHCLTWLGTYAAHTPSIIVGDNTSIRLDDENMPQPDVLMMIEPARGGQASISEDDYIEGAPELVVEVASSTVSLDLNAKLRVYRRGGVREYVAWRVRDRAVDWFILRGDEFGRLTVGADGIYKSEVFPGLWLDAAALMSSDLARVLEVLRAGVASPEHGDFVRRLGG